MLMRTIALSAAMLFPYPAFSEEIKGPARAIDGGSLIVGSRYVRLCGVDDPSSGGGRFRRDSKALADLVAGRAVRCVPLGEGTPCDGIANGEGYKREIAQCFVADQDLAAELIRSGSACAWTAESGDAYAGLGCTSEARQ